ncbi:MAG TPA: SDR family oxidoreductase [Candidatus Dormibacteraeota bacterium]
MRVFVTGASGWIGSATVAELLKAGHQVVGLARSDASAAAVSALGAEVHRGSLDDLGSLRAAAAASDGVVHLGYSHDFSRMAEAAEMDRQALETIGEALVGTGRPLVFASGVLGAAPGRVLTETDTADPSLHPRIAASAAALALAEQGVRTAAVRFAPTVHGPGDHGFVATLVKIARDRGVSGYVGDGASRWPAVHRLDAARLVALAVDGAPPGSVLHAIGDEGIPTREIAEAIGSGLGLPVVSVPAEQASEHFGWIGRFFGVDCRASNELTRKLMAWAPTHVGLLADLKAGHYFHAEVGRGSSLR